MSHKDSPLSFYPKINWLIICISSSDSLCMYRVGTEQNIRYHGRIKIKIRKIMCSTRHSLLATVQLLKVLA